MASKALRSDDKVFQAVNYSILTILLVAVLFPLWFLIIASFSDPDAINRGEGRIGKSPDEQKRNSRNGIEAQTVRALPHRHTHRARWYNVRRKPRQFPEDSP
jgi:ABC-type glycerol-3-phosphate transport system permease component